MSNVTELYDQNADRKYSLEVKGPDEDGYYFAAIFVDGGYRETKGGADRGVAIETAKAWVNWHRMYGDATPETIEL